jgi:imidazolonepropionase-like amidohydrolase
MINTSNAVLTLLLTAAFATVAQAEATAFLNVNVLTMTDDMVVTGQTVVVEDGLITLLGPVDSTPLPHDCTVVDGTDRYLMPGLAEMHAHIPDAVAPELDRVLTLFAVNGVTIVRGMLGQASHLSVRTALSQGQIFGPRLVTSGPSLNGNSVSGAADGARQVAAQNAAGYDFLKIHPGLDADEFAAIAAAANELGMPFAGHVPILVGLDNALAAGMATIDHLDGYLAALMPADSDASGGYGGFFDVMLAEQLLQDRIPELAARTAAAGTWNVPTEALFEHRIAAETAVELSHRPEMQYMPAATVRQWVRAKELQEQERGFSSALGNKAIRIRRDLIKALHDAGAGLLLGSDAPQVFNVPGFSLHDELQLLVEAGLSPYAALAAGTSEAARFLGSNTGTIEIGRDADLVLLDANPFEDIRHTRRIHGVMLRGHWYSAHDLHARLEAYRTTGN